MAPITMDTTTAKQPIVEACNTNTTNDAGNNAVVLPYRTKVNKDGQTTVDEVETTNSLKRARGTSEDNSESVSDESAKRIKTKTLDFATAPIEPIVFGNRRQAVCESVTYYNAYSSSLYTQNGVARGLYLDKEARPQDVFKAQVIITTMGGGRVRDDDTGNMTRVSHQSSNNSTFRALQTAKDGRALIPIIVGRNHPHWPSPPSHNFSVLDYFKITDIWAELAVMKVGSPAVRVWCVRLEKADLNTVSWWDHNSTNYVHGPAAPEQKCDSCLQQSKEILQTGWTCLNHECRCFFKDSNGQPITAGEYSDAFLQERKEFIGPIPNPKPDIPSAEELNDGGLTGSESIFRDGIVCPLCGCCSSRRFWSRWTCENPECTFEMATPMSPYPKNMIKTEVEAFNKTVHRFQNILHNAHSIDTDTIATKLDTTAVKHRNLAQGSYQVSQFLLPDHEGHVIGSVTVFRASEAACEQGPDAMFDELSIKDIGLRRNIVSARGSMIEGWTRHFAQNWGARYKFGVSVQSKGFDEAPDAILQAVQRLKWAGQTAVPMAAQFIESTGLTGADIHDANVDFNECLSLGYMEEDRIKYHDDGEKELGPTVATLSLGSPAMMSFRPKKWSGMTDVVAEAVYPKGDGKEYGEVLAFPLYHGDMLVMHGTKIHRYYEHKVEPSGNRRFALTCRYIEPSKMKDDEARHEAIVKGTLPAHAEKFVYNGDEHLASQSGAQDGIVKNDIGAANTTQRDATIEQSTIDRYNFRSRKPGMIYKGMEEP